MAYQRNFWKGQITTHKGREDTIRGNPEAPPMHGGPGDFDGDLGTGADAPKLGSSQPRVKGNNSGELPLRHANTLPRRRQMQQVMRAQALRRSDDGTNTAAIGGGAGTGAGT